MDVTTSFRFHWGEVFYSTVFRLLQVGIISVLPLTCVVYEVVFNGAAPPARWSCSAASLGISRTPLGQAMGHFQRIFKCFFNFAIILR